MELEHGVKIFPIDSDLQSKVEELVKEGWELVPGVKPVAIYSVVRLKAPAEAAPSGQAIGIMKIDDSLVYVIPAKKDQN